MKQEFSEERLDDISDLKCEGQVLMLENCNVSFKK